MLLLYLFNVEMCKIDRQEMFNNNIRGGSGFIGSLPHLGGFAFLYLYKSDTVYIFTWRKCSYYR